MTEHPWYLDEASMRALNHDDALMKQANWLVHIGKHVNDIAPYKEAAAVQQFITKLKLARSAYESFAPCDKYRIAEDLSTLDKLNEMIANAEQCEAKPLPKKSKLENLYWCFATTGAEEWRVIRDGRASNVSPFQLFMAVVVRLVEGDTESDICDHIEKTTQAYKRIVMGQKAKK